MSSPVLQFDLCVVGGGSAGIGAAVAGARAGLLVLLVEKGDRLGGNAVRGGVHSWEPGVGGDVLPREIYHRLREIPHATAVWSIGRHVCWPKPGLPRFPGGECVVDPARTYEDTQLRCGTKGYAEETRTREQWHGVVFEPEAYAEEVEQLFLETGRGTLWKKARFLDATGEAGRVNRLRVEHDGAIQEIQAHYVVDATADGLVCQSLGCECLIGSEPSDQFGEPGAPQTGDSRQINAVTLVFRVTPVDFPAIEPLDSAGFQNLPKRWPAVHLVHYPNGDRCLNMLPTMEGREFWRWIESGPEGYAQAYAECERRVRGYWHYLQTQTPEFRSFRMSWIAPALGVRESRRVVGEYLLTQQDLLAGLSGQRHPDLIAIADHPMDLHGEENKGCPELSQPYGIPLRCLIPKGWKNLLVAGRCASFSHIAASSCRLSRTMMDLGYAAGLAAKLAQETNADVSHIDAAVLRRRLVEQGATLSWPSKPIDSENLCQKVH